MIRTCKWWCNLDMIKYDKTEQIRGIDRSTCEIVFGAPRAALEEHTVRITTSVQAKRTEMKPQQRANLPLLKSASRGDFKSFLLTMPHRTLCSDLQPHPQFRPYSKPKRKETRCRVFHALFSKSPLGPLGCCRFSAMPGYGFT